MALFTVERRSPLPASEAWRRVTDWARHGAHVPLTEITSQPPGRTRVGTTILARTGIGRVGFDDPMRVVRWEPPDEHGDGLYRLEKCGSVVAGWAEIRVGCLDGGSLVRWCEDIRLLRPPWLLDLPAAWIGRLVFGHLVNALLTTA